jgi:hypothetical protein
MNRKAKVKYSCLAIVVLCVLMLGFLPSYAQNKELSDAVVAREIVKDSNKAIIDAFLQAELRDVNEHAVKPLLNQHPSLEFFVKQVDRGPLNSLFFLETWVNRLAAAQKDIDNILMQAAFSADERQKLMELKPTTSKIISYGIPLMKRDFYRVALAAKELADEKKKNPVQLIRDPAFRDAIYRHCEPTPQGLDKALGELSEGELICMKLGWVLDGITATRLWLTVNDNNLPEENDYMAYRKKRSAWFEKRLKRIYGQSEGSDNAADQKKDAK